MEGGLTVHTDYPYHRLKGIVGEARVSRENFDTLTYAHDLANLPRAAHLIYKLRPNYVVVPKSQREVVNIVRLAHESALPIVPRGSATYGYGGAVPTKGGIALDTRLLNAIGGIDAAARTLEVEPGVTWSQAQEYADRHGHFLPCHPTSGPAATVGGWIGVGGVGVGAYKYGGVRAAIRSLEVVLPDASRLVTAPSRAASGLGNHVVTDLFVGSEGTLGVITKVRLNVYPKPEEVRPLAYSFPTMDAASGFLSTLAGSHIVPYHVWLVDASHFRFLRATGRHPPVDGPAVGVVLAGRKALLDAEAGALGEAATGQEGTAADTEAARWLWDERLFEYRARKISGGIVRMEALFPLDRLPQAIAETRGLARKMKIQMALHGILVSPSTVSLIPYFLTDERSPKSAFALGFAEAFRRLSLRMDGHPVGVGFYLSKDYDAIAGPLADVARAIRLKLDPRRLMNPDKITGVNFQTPILHIGEVPMPKWVMTLQLRALGLLKRLAPRDKYLRRGT